MLLVPTYIAMKKDNNSVSYLGLSLLTHGALVAAVAVSATLTPMPEGTVSSDIEFTVMEAPKGNQLKTVDIGRNESEAPSQPEESLPTAKNITPEEAPEAVVVAPPPAPKKQKIAKSKPKPAKKLSMKPVATETVKESPVAVAAVPNKAKKSKLDKISDDQLKKDLAELNAMTGDKDIDDGFDDMEDIESEMEEEMKALATAAVVAEKVPEQPKKVAKPAPLPKKAKPSPPAIASGMPQKSKQLKHESNMNYGVPSGVRDYKDLVQMSGNVPPQYPQKARRKREMGKVELMYFVTSDGRVSSLRLVKSSGYSQLDNEAIRAIRKYRYRSGQQGHTSHTINFKLRGKTKAAGGTLRMSLNDNKASRLNN